MRHGTYKEKDKEVLRKLWEQRKDRSSPVVSPVASDDEADFEDTKIGPDDTLGLDPLPEPVIPGLELPPWAGPNTGVV